MEPVDINQLLKMISTMDKNELEKNIKKATDFINSQNLSKPDNSKEK